MKLRSLALGLSLLTAGTVIGVSTQQFASADVSSGDRPVLVPIETCRIVDTRPAPNTVGPKASKLGTADTMSVDAQQAGTDCTGKIPAGASALSLNVTAVNATANSFLTVWPGGARPTASALNPTPGQRVFNAVTSELNADQAFQIYNDSGEVNVIVDINGYYEHHDHDDRYPLTTDVDAALAEKKFLSLNIYADPGLNFDTPLGDLDDAGNRGQDVDFNFTIPPDYSAGTPIEIRLLMYPMTNPCTIDLIYSWSLVTSPGRENFRVDSVENTPPTRVTAGEDIAEEFVFEYPGTDLLPLDSFGAGFFWNGGPTSCATVFSGASLTYE